MRQSYWVARRALRPFFPRSPIDAATYSSDPCQGCGVATLRATRSALDRGLRCDTVRASGEGDHLLSGAVHGPHTPGRIMLPRGDGVAGVRAVLLGHAINPWAGRAQRNDLVPSTGGHGVAYSPPAARSGTRRGRGHGRRSHPPFATERAADDRLVVVDESVQEALDKFERAERHRAGTTGSPVPNRIEPMLSRTTSKPAPDRGTER